jgi:hypothetical protein
VRYLNAFFSTYKVTILVIKNIGVFLAQLRVNLFYIEYKKRQNPFLIKFNNFIKKVIITNILVIFWI